MAATAKNDNTRRIEKGACSWCGHGPHDEPCRSNINTRAPGESVDTWMRCPCTKHEWDRSRSQNTPGADGTDSSGGR